MQDLYRSYRITDAAGVGKFLCVVQDAAEGDVKKPTAANAGQLVGVTQEDQLTQNRSVLVKEGGWSFVTAAGAVTVGDRLQINGTSGKVSSAESVLTTLAATAVLIEIVGQARSAATADGDIIEMRIHPFSKETPVS